MNAHSIALERFKKDPSKAYQKHIAEVYHKEGDIPLTLDKAMVEEITQSEASDIILKYEWLKTMPMGGLAFYALKAASGETMGVVCFSAMGGGPANISISPLAKPVCLSRGACTHLAPKNSASFLIPKAIKLANKKYGWNIIFAYSDSDAGEIGTIYQACNWLYICKADNKGHYHSDYFSPDGTQCITSYMINHNKGGPIVRGLGWNPSLGIPVRKFLVNNGWTRVKRFPKGKWVTFAGDNKTIKELKANLRVAIIADGSKDKPYPKRN